MIHTSLIADLKRVDDMLLKAHQEFGHPFIFDEEFMEKVKPMIEFKKYTIKLLANSVGFQVIDRSNEV